MRYRFARQEWARNLMVYTRSSDLTRLKNLLDDGGDHHTVFKLIYNDLQASSGAAAPACCQGGQGHQDADGVSGWDKSAMPANTHSSYYSACSCGSRTRIVPCLCGNSYPSWVSWSSLGWYPLTKAMLLCMCGEAVISNAAASAMQQMATGT